MACWYSMAKFMAAYFYAKIVQNAQKANLFTMLRRCLSYAKTAQTESNQTAFELLRCSLFYAKIVQKAHKKKWTTYFFIVRLSDYQRSDKLTSRIYQPSPRRMMNILDNQPLYILRFCHQTVSKAQIWKIWAILGCLWQSDSYEHLSLLVLRYSRTFSTKA